MYHYFYSGPKQRTSRQICSSLTELTNTVMNKSLRLGILYQIGYYGNMFIYIT